MRYDLAILGGGQLARMTIQAAQRIGIRCISIDPDPESPAAQVAPSLVTSMEDVDALARLLAEGTVLTLENEFLPASTLEEAARESGARKEQIIPFPSTLATIQDKLLQRQAYAKAGVPSPKAVPLPDWSAHDVPVVLKTRKGGYDGKGTRTARTTEELAAHLSEISDPENWLAEEFVPFVRELAVIVFLGDCEGAFPTMVTEQKGHVCDLVYPASVDATQVAMRAVEAVGMSPGLYGVELFECKDGQIMVNEIAPRPHNTGHYTLDWGGTSQFEQHVRVALGLPLDPAPAGAPTTMANLLGVDGPFDLRAATTAALALHGVHVHWYGKQVMRLGRKMGHINAPSRGFAVQAREAFFAAGSLSFGP